MLLDVLEAGGLLEARDLPVQQSQPIMDVWVVVSDHSNVALEVLDIDRVESDDGGEQTEVGLSQLVADQKLLVFLSIGLQECLYLVEVVE